MPFSRAERHFYLVFQASGIAVNLSKSATARLRATGSQPLSCLFERSDRHWSAQDREQSRFKGLQSGGLNGSGSGASGRFPAVPAVELIRPICKPLQPPGSPPLDRPGCVRRAAAGAGWKCKRRSSSPVTPPIVRGAARRVEMRHRSASVSIDCLAALLSSQLSSSGHDAGHDDDRHDTVRGHQGQPPDCVVGRREEGIEGPAAVGQGGWRRQWPGRFAHGSIRGRFRGAVPHGPVAAGRW
jgi:hypothetical protein